MYNIPKETYAQRRRIVTKFGLLGFKLVYLPHYFPLPFGPFHIELDQLLTNPEITRLLVVGFRGSAKSTNGNLALTLYAALEKPELYKFIIPISATMQQAKAGITNIKYELEQNTLIKQDYGDLKPRSSKDSTLEPTLESDEEWQSTNLLLDNGVRVMARSRGQNIRGYRHLQYRPRLVVLDDVEDIEWLRNKDNRDLDEQWLRGDVLPAVEKDIGKVLLIGSWLHDDGLLARMKKSDTFLVKQYPLLDADNHCAWPAKYPTQASLDEARKELGEVNWQREMLLRVVPSEGAVVRPEDIHYYDELPTEENQDVRKGRRGHGVDFAISLKESADYTTCVDGDVFYLSNKPKICILPNPLNAHLDFADTLRFLKSRIASGGSHIFFPEDVGYQKAAIQEMVNGLLAVHPVRPATDKRSRFMTAATYIKNGTVLFPRNGCQELLNQMFNFGVEAHDDLVDGLVNLILGLSETGLGLPGFVRG